MIVYKFDIVMLTLEKVMVKPQAEILFKKEKIFNKDHSWIGQKQIIFDWFIAYFVSYQCNH